MSGVVFHMIFEGDFELRFLNTTCKTSDQMRNFSKQKIKKNKLKIFLLQKQEAHVSMT